MIPLHTHAVVGPKVPPGLIKVVRSGDPLPNNNQHAALWVDDPGAVEPDTWSAYFSSGSIGSGANPRLIHSPQRADVVSPGDVIRVRQGSSLVSVLYRRSANSNALFVSERCNSYCLMCSQPPRDAHDSWRISELLELIPLIDRDLPQLGITGGEPTLLGRDLEMLLAACRDNLPSTKLHILTNGRRFADADFTESVAAVGAVATWAIPVYADVPARHDYIVQARGAFSETLHGIYNLAERQQEIEIRFVLHKESIPRLEPFAEFVWRNLPFVAHVAFMGLEPMGFGKLNRDRLWIDPADYVPSLERAVMHLAHRGLVTSVYNLPLCILPIPLRPFARKSISDWKNRFVPACEGCAARGDCSGFFASAGPEWISREVRAIERAS